MKPLSDSTCRGNNARSTTVPTINGRSFTTPASLALVETQVTGPVQAPPQPAVDQAGPPACYRHPDAQTGLRCNRCGQPICVKCAKPTPVGYRCPSCIRQQQDKFYTGLVWDYLIAVVIALPLAFLAAFGVTILASDLGVLSFFLVLMGAGYIGRFIADAVHWAVRRRRSRYLAYLVTGSLVVATLPCLLVLMVFGDFVSLTLLGILLVVGSGTILSRLR